MENGSSKINGVRRDLSRHDQDIKDLRREFQDFKGQVLERLGGIEKQIGQNHSYHVRRDNREEEVWPKMSRFLLDLLKLVIAVLIALAVNGGLL